MKHSPEELIELLTVPAVLLPIRAKLKGPHYTDWQKITFQQTQCDTYQTRLKSHQNTGVLLGSPSGNLVTIDFDDLETAKSFLARNPWHRNTLRTNSKRGFNLWLIMEDDYPEKVVNLKSKLTDSHIGEWRGGRALTVLQGIHPEGVSYQIAQHIPPLRLKFGEIDFGGGFPPCHINQINNIKVINDISEEREGGESWTLSEIINRAQKAKKSLQKNKRLWPLYSEFIDRRYFAEQGQRNAQLVAMTTFLAFNTSDEITLKLVNSFYDINEAMFTDSKRMHSNEAKCQLENAKARWLENLSTRERILVNGFPAKHQEAFRILENLAKIEANDSPVGIFYLSCHKLGMRLGIDCKEASRILNHFKAQGVISMLKKGDKYREGVRAKASFYKWLLD